MIGEISPGGLLIHTKEYYRISYSMTGLFMLGHLPRFIWLIAKFTTYIRTAEHNPGTQRESQGGSAGPTTVRVWVSDSGVAQWYSTGLATTRTGVPDSSVVAQLGTRP